MRSILLSTLALALVLSGCNCGGPGGGTVTSGADPNVLEPTAKVGEEYVLDFGKVRAGATYESHIVIENLGRLDWNIDKLGLRSAPADAGAGTSSLAISPVELPHKVATGGKIDVKVTWSPRVAEGLLDYVDIEGDAELTPKITVKVIGLSLAPIMKVCVKDPPAGTPECDTDAAKLEPAQYLSVNFGVIGIKDPPVTKTLLIKNLAVKDEQDIRLHLTGVAFQPGISPEFTVLYPSILNVGPEAQMEVTVTYMPVDGGSDEGVLEITGDDPTKTLVRVNLKAGGNAPRLCAEPTTLDFGQIGQGTSDEREITITSCGVTPAEITSLALAAGSSPTFTLPSPPQLPMPPLAPGVYYKLKVKFSPVDLGAVAGRVTFTSNAGEGFVFLKGEGVKEPTCDIQISPKSIDFGQIPLNGFADRVIFGTNLGQKTCHLTKLELTGAASFAVQSSPAPGAEVAPGATFSISLRFTPAGTTAETASYVIDSDDPAEPSVTVTLKGTGKTPGPCEIQISPANLNFGTVAAGSAKAMELFLYNFGTDQCWLGSAALTAASVGFALTDSPTIVMAQPIDSGAKVRYEVTFSPTKGGNFVGALNIQAGPNAWGMKGYAVALTGVAGEAAICITPEKLDFGVQAPGTSREMGFTIQSCGPGLLELRGINLEAGTATDYSITQKPNVPQQLAPSQTAIVKVKLDASSSGPAFGRVKVLSNDRNKPAATVVLVANSNGCFTSVLNCAPTALHFPKTATGLTSSLTFSCVSLGTVDVDLTSIKLTASSSTAFTLSHKTLPPKVKPGESFRVAVDYSPTQVTSDVGTIEIASNDCQRPLQTIALDALSKAPDFPKCIPPKVFQPVTKWKWENPSVSPKFKTVWITPMVAPLEDTNGDSRIDEDDTPSVIFTSSEGVKMNVGDPSATDMTPPAVLRAVDGKNGAELWTMAEAGLALNSEAQIAVGDIDGDNKVEIIGTLRFVSPGTGNMGMEGKYKTGRLVAFENDGTFKWVSDYWNRPDSEIEDGSSISLADLDADGVPEIIIGSSVFDPDGTLKWEGKAGIGSTGHGVFSVVADLDQDGRQEVIAGNSAYAADGRVIWTYGRADGLSIVVNVDADPEPEVVMRTSPAEIVILKYDGTKKYGPWTLTGLPEDGICAAPITAADLDGDGMAELAIPAGNTFFAMKPTTGAIMWQQPIEDYQNQCGAAGAAAFDFEGDGKYEAVYQDTGNTFVYRGTDGTITFQDVRYSATIWETPVIADVDNDGHADILVTQDSGAGLKMINNSTNDWVGTTHIWNEHAYHFTNVYEGGVIPRVEKASWKVFNAYRANMPYCLP
ncbi:MAG TPA: choice-of-anchor D domain-containing protein [Myxococcales bacterium]|jgi:hypothetical protein